MWQHSFLVDQVRMQELLDEADRNRRWRLQKSEDRRPADVASPGRSRAFAARAIAALSRSAARVARRLDGRIVVDVGPERLVRDRIS